MERRTALLCLSDHERLASGRHVLVSASPHPASVFSDRRRGPHKVAIYNEAFIPLAGKTHPRLMGIGFQDAYPEIWHDIKPVFDVAEATKKAVDVVQIPLMVERDGFLEETYFTGNFNPLRGVTGEVEGFYNALFEATEQKLQDRRATMLNMIAAQEHRITPETVGSHIEAALLTNGLDVPMAMLYQIDNSREAPDCDLTLRLNIGVPEHHPLLVRHASFRSNKGVIPLLRRAKGQITTEAVGNEWQGIDWKGHGDPCTHCSVLPLATGGRLYGFLIVGANPRRPVDHVYHQFVQDIAQRVSSVIASTFSQQQALERQLRLEQGLAESERQIRYMAQHASVAMVNVSMAGEIMWANEIYFTLVGGMAVSPDYRATPFMSAVSIEDQPTLANAWNKINTTPESGFTLEVRMTRQFLPPAGDPVAATMLLSAFPYLDNGSAKSIMCCMTDVSRLKWAESWQARMAQDAHEAKARQSEFTDTISHEIRNPLSAIFQLADSIVASGDGRSLEECNATIAAHIEDAKTILICAQHQKRIVDDVLLLSKLDFTLSVLTPSQIRPESLVDETIAMLAAVIKTDDINLTHCHDVSLAMLGVDRVLCDALRVKQILINLVSNAIKFTKRRKVRRVTITLGATLSDPRTKFPDTVHWVSEQASSDPTSGDGWGSGSEVYLTFSISDTGVGMCDESIQRLFSRFEQATPKTAMKYGGSGLGLFISEKLCKKQGGNIGVASEPGKGSTFVFYVTSRRAEPANGLPEDVLSNGLVTGVAELHIDKHKPAPPSKHEMHVLLVEDNLVNQRILQKQLQKAGCVVSVANHGVEALTHLEQSSRWAANAGSGPTLDIILMDCEMPVMDGLTCTREIRAREVRGTLLSSPPQGTFSSLPLRIPIIAVTANARAEQVDAALQAGVDRVVTKPFAVSELMSVMRDHVGPEGGTRQTSVS